MQTIKIPGTDLAVSRAALGTLTFGLQTVEADALAMVSAALDAGVNFIDTANAYGDGVAERVLGKALAGRRDAVVLGSKVGLATSDGKGLRRDAILTCVDASLRRLGTDRLDICYLHQPDPATPLEESLEAMECLIRSGKARYAGASNYPAWEMCRMLALAGEDGPARIRFAQPPYSLLARRAEDELLPFCKHAGVAAVAYNPLAGGMLTGKHNPAGPQPGTRFDVKRNYKDRYWNDAAFEAVEVLRPAARAEGRSLVSLALNWILHHSGVHCVTVGASRLEQLRENLAALEDGPLAPESLAACERAWDRMRGVAPSCHR